MGSKVRKVSQEKLQGKVYTPKWVVEKILNEIDYKGDNVIGKTIVDPACGDGQFLAAVVERIMSKSNPEELASNLQHVHGWDIDGVAISACKERLDQLIPEPLRPFSWNISRSNPLQTYVETASVWSQGNPKYDFVIGNPPYIRIQHLDEVNRAFIVKTFRYCNNGATDIFFAFIELGLSLLKTGAKLGFIVPNSFLTSQAGAYMRKDLASTFHVSFLSNFGAQKLFDDASTYNAIVVIQRSGPAETDIEEAVLDRVVKRYKISHERLHERSWVFREAADIGIEGAVPLSNVCSIHVGVTTLADKVFVIQGQEKDGWVEFTSRVTGQQYKIERGILKTAIKASRSRERRTTEWIIWPYLKGTSKLIAEQSFSEQYPFAYQYLVEHRERLDARDNGKAVAGGWYAFGRSQALSTVFGEKIVFPPMSAEPEFSFEPDAEAVVYSGYFIKYTGDVKALLSELTSERMKLWQDAHGRDFRGGWKSQSKNTIAEFPVPKELSVGAT